MIIDYSELRQLDRSWDVAVVGAGAAGISLAVSLAKRGQQVLLLESGGPKMNAATQDLYKGSVSDEAHHGPLHQYRKRVLGGTTIAWGGRCSPFDEIDFEERPYIDGGGWPITLEDLQPFYREAHAYCDLGKYEYDAATAIGERTELLPGFASSDVLQDRIWRFSLPTNFGKKYTGFLKDSTRVTVVTHANVTHIQLDEHGRRVQHLVLKTLADGGAAGRRATGGSGRICSCGGRARIYPAVTEFCGRAGRWYRQRQRPSRPLLRLASVRRFRHRKIPPTRTRR